MNICFLCLRSFLNRRERGSILETVGGRSGVLERLTRNQKPIPHLSVFMVTNGRSRRISLYSLVPPEIIFRKIATTRRVRGKKKEKEKRIVRTLSPGRKIRWPSWIGWKIAAEPLHSTLSAIFRFKSLLIKIYLNLEEDSWST